MTFIVNDSKFKIKQINPGENMWFIRDGFTITPRAGFEINNKCPKEYRAIINECLRNGWVKPVAYMRDDEYTWESLKE